MPHDQVSAGDARLLAVAIGAYDHHGPLDEVVAVTGELVNLFTRGGFVQDHPELVGECVHVETIDGAIKEWFPEKKEDDQLLVYWTGHGLRSNISGLLLAGTNTPVDPASYEAIAPGLLVELLIRSSAQSGLLIIDTCFSGTAEVIAEQLMVDLKMKELPSPKMVGRRVGVLTTSHSLRTVTSPVFGAALVKVLGDPDRGSASWGRRDAKIGLREVPSSLSN